MLVAAAVCPVSGGCKYALMNYGYGPNVGPDLSTGPRRLAPLDLSAIPDNVPPASTPSDPPSYQQLSADECRKRAARNSVLGNQIARAVADPVVCTNGPGQSVRWLRNVTANHLSDEARNRTAGAALDLYYQLLEAELLSDLQTASQVEVDALVTYGEKAIAEGAEESPEFYTLRKQQIETRADRVKLRAGIGRLNRELKPLLGLDANSPPLLPVDSLHVAPAAFDVEQAVRLGLTAREDLNALRDLIAGLDYRTLEAVRQSLDGLSPSLAVVSTASRVLAPGLRDTLSFLGRPDLDRVRNRLAGYLAEQEREVEKDIRTAAVEWESERELVALSKKQAALAVKRASEFEARKKEGAGVETDLRKARLESLKAEVDVVREAIKWQRADVKVRQAMGQLFGEQ
ncbi:hypothetical protein FRUB_08095 [Fimbriiglobus ruber]|uniref:Uncharacterized protein n=1 Tax=Fimbriiglobus ruber TaxID=1908690 RepID=A0A225D1Y2_9BACT|nr:hypothetical protein FRUB_08095 [Fimbriiglobus ruber]